MLPQFVSARGKLAAALAGVPGLDERSRAAMESYLDDFFAQVGTSEEAEKNLFRTCRKSQ